MTHRPASLLYSFLLNPAAVIAAVRERVAFRRALRRLHAEDPRLLSDVGLEVEAAMEEAALPFWADARLRQIFPAEPAPVRHRRRSLRRSVIRECEPRP